MGSALGGYGYRQYLTWVDRGSGVEGKRPMGEARASPVVPEARG